MPKIVAIIPAFDEENSVGKVVAAIPQRIAQLAATSPVTLLLFAVVPVVYGLARGARARSLLHVIITVGALSAILGVVQPRAALRDGLVDPQSAEGGGQSAECREEGCSLG